jgi:hypothetical protein
VFVVNAARLKQKIRRIFVYPTTNN